MFAAGVLHDPSCFDRFQDRDDLMFAEFVFRIEASRVIVARKPLVFNGGIFKEAYRTIFDSNSTESRNPRDRIENGGIVSAEGGTMRAMTFD